MKIRNIVFALGAFMTLGLGYPSDNEGQPLEWSYEPSGKFHTYSLKDKDFFFKVWCEDKGKAKYHLVSNGKSQDVISITYIEDYYGVSTRTYPRSLKTLFSQEKIEISTDAQIHVLSVKPTHIHFNCQ